MGKLSDSNKAFIRELLAIEDKTSRSFYPLYLHEDSGEGWKASIQGHNQADTIQIFDAITDYLQENKINAKFALSKCHLSRDKPVSSDAERKHRIIQSHKVATIYCPSNFDIKRLCKDIKNLLDSVGYVGWKGIGNPPDYEKFSDGIYFRNDRDKNGEYIRADNGFKKKELI